jgi:hypothetical protein
VSFGVGFVVLAMLTPKRVPAVMLVAAGLLLSRA